MADLKKQTEAILLKLGAAPRKRFGQNFMVDEPALAALAAALEIVPGENVLEIGPGLGHLTRVLEHSGAKLTVVEKDALYSGFLRKEFPAARVLERDFLDFDWKELRLEAPVKVIGNIPYNITSPILERLVRERRRVKLAVLTVQAEVAARLTASPGTKDWGALSAFVQFHADVGLLQKIGRDRFWPSPRVDSAAVRLRFRAPAVSAKDEELLFRLLRRAFQKRRKILLNGLVGGPEGYSRDFVLNALERSQIDVKRRPETLTLEEWARLSNRFMLE